MTSLIFSVETLANTTASPISDWDNEDAWKALAAKLTASPKLVPVSADHLRQRWKSGRAALAVHGDQIVSYTSAVDVYSAPLREAMSAASTLDAASLPGHDILAFTSGWTLPQWRRRGINLALRRHLISRWPAETLFVSVSSGVGASHVLRRMGYTDLRVDQAPFLFTTVFASQGSDVPCVRLSQTALLPRPEALPVPPEQHLHLWVSSAKTAAALSRSAARAASGVLSAWTQAIHRARLEHPGLPLYPLIEAEWP